MFSEREWDIKEEKNAKRESNNLLETLMIKSIINAFTALDLVKTNGKT